LAAEIIAASAHGAFTDLPLRHEFALDRLRSFVLQQRAPIRSATFADAGHTATAAFAVFR